MGCYNCKCDYCARSSELDRAYFTPGEIDDMDKICYTCEDCKYWDGDLNKKSQKHTTCAGYVEPIKYAESRNLVRRERLKRSDKEAIARRKHFRLISK